jgi:hypothetical protein
VRARVEAVDEEAAIMAVVLHEAQPRAARARARAVNAELKRRWETLREPAERTARGHESGRLG